MAQPVVKFIGRTTDFKGKTLWEIVGNLKNFGVGRIIIRHMFQRYEEPCFMKILKVEAQPNEVRVAYRRFDKNTIDSFVHQHSSPTRKSVKSK